MRVRVSRDVARQVAQDLIGRRTDGVNMPMDRQLYEEARDNPEHPLYNELFDRPDAEWAEDARVEHCRKVLKLARVDFTDRESGRTWTIPIVASDPFIPRELIPTQRIQDDRAYALEGVRNEFQRLHAPIKRAFRVSHTVPADTLPDVKAEIRLEGERIIELVRRYVSGV